MILNEGSRDKLLEPYLNLLNSKGIQCNLSQLKMALLAKFVNEANIRSLSLDSNYYLAGVARYYFEGELTENKEVNLLNPNIKDVFIDEICQRLSGLIVFFRNAHIDSVGTEFIQPENFGELKLNALLKKYRKEIDKELGIETPVKHREPKPDTLDRSDRIGNGYSFEILYHYSDARKYRPYTEPGAWCITYGEQHFNAYIKKLGIHYVIFKKDGFENVPRRKGVNWTTDKPQDEYGNSLIAVLQKNSSWEPVYITSRWNHGSNEDKSYCNADHAYTTEEFMRVTGVSQEDLMRVFNIWKKDREDIQKQINSNRKEINRKRLNVLRIFKYAQMRINGGNWENAFGEYELKLVALMTGCEKESKLRDILRGLTSSEEKEALKKQYQKYSLKCARCCSVRIDDSVYYFLIDGNKILFETITEADGPYDSALYHFSTSDECFPYREVWAPAKNLNNIVYCQVLNGIMLYNYRTHSFVDVNGTKKFKYVTDVTSGDIWDMQDSSSCFYEVKMSESQGALINLATNQPLRLPNGECWYESLDICGKEKNNYSRFVETNFVSAQNKALYIVYDRASGESYIYDLNTRSFKKPPKPEGGWMIDTSKPFGEGKYLGGLYTIQLTCYDDYYMSKRFLLYKDGEPFSICGINEFLKIDYLGNGFYFGEIDKPVGNFLLYNIIEDKTYNLPDDINGTVKYDGKTVRKYGDIEKCNPPLVLFFTALAKTDKAYAFSTIDKKFLINPISGDYLLDVYGVGCQNCSVTVFNDDRTAKYCLRLVGGELVSDEGIDLSIIKNPNSDKIFKKLAYLNGEIDEVCTKGDFQNIIKNLILESLNRIISND